MTDMRAIGGTGAAILFLLGWLVSRAFALNLSWCMVPGAFVLGATLFLWWLFSGFSE